MYSLVRLIAGRLFSYDDIVVYITIVYETLFIEAVVTKRIIIIICTMISRRLARIHRGRIPPVVYARFFFYQIPPSSLHSNSEFLNVQFIDY